MAFNPIPVPVRGSATFNADAEAFAQGISQFAADYNALSSVIDGALTSTSTTSLTIGTGSKVLTVQTGLGYVIGYPLRISSSASPTNYMDGIVTDYNTGTGSLTVNVLSVSGSGTIAAWNTMILPGGGNFAGLTYNKFTQRQVFANEVSLASASTVDFTTGNSNQFVITGTTTITAVTIDQGAVIKARFASSCTLTHGTNLQVQGGANYTTAAGDIATFTSNGTVARVEISRADGRPVNLPVLNATSDPSFTSTSSTDHTSPDWVNGRINARLLGIDQTWQDVTASRAFSTTYTNTTGKPIQLFVNGNFDTFKVTLNGVEYAMQDGTAYAFISLIIPNGVSYNISGASSSIIRWLELR